MCTDDFTVKHVLRSQHAPPPAMKIAKSSLVSDRLTPMPVGEPSAHAMPSIGIHVHVPAGATSGGTPAGASCCDPDEEPPQAARTRNQPSRVIVPLYAGVVGI